MNPLYVIYPIAVLIPLAVNLYAARGNRQHDQAVSIAILILVIWACERIVAAAVPVPDNKAFAAMLNVIACISIMGAWAVSRHRYLLVLAGLLAVQTVLIAAFVWSWQIFNYRLTYLPYVRIDNALWLLQLATVAAPGAGSVAGRPINFLRPVDRGRHRVGHPT